MKHAVFARSCFSVRIDAGCSPVFVLICAKDQYVIEFVAIIEVLESASY